MMPNTTLPTDIADPAKRVPEFRADINGLRAWAVIAVMLYHFGIPGFNGGFIGVDVFFVISGFLMTGIIVNGLEKDPNHFSVVHFYMARARRILPVLIVLCACLMLAGWALILPFEYKELSTQVLYCLNFLSNFLFWQQGGYFEVGSHEKWLLHTWSLSVEWQFYLLLPILLRLLWKIRANRHFLTLSISFIFFLSFILCTIVTDYKPDAAFYLLPTRAWQMLAGGLVFLHADVFTLKDRSKKIVELIGFLLIIIAILIFDIFTPWPGWHAALPVTGAVFVLISAQHDSLWSNNRLAQWLGTRSYSIYLWHWPLVVALFYRQKHHDPLMVTTAILLTVFISHLSYSFIENPARKKLADQTIIRNILYLVAAIIVTVSIGQISQPINEQIRFIEAERWNRNTRTRECLVWQGTWFKKCHYGGSKNTVILLGDSHANAVVSSIHNALAKNDSGLLQLTYAGCPTIKGSIELAFGNMCHLFNDWAFQQIHSMPADIPLIIINRLTWAAFGGVLDIPPGPHVYFSTHHKKTTPEFLQEFRQRFLDTTCEYAKERTVYLMRPFPEMMVKVPRALAQDLKLNHQSDIHISINEYYQRNAFVLAIQDDAVKRCGVKILDPLPYLCTNDKCMGVKNDWPLYFDDNHLSEFGNQLLIPLFTPIFGVKAE